MQDMQSMTPTTRRKIVRMATGAIKFWPKDIAAIHGLSLADVRRVLVEEGVFKSTGPPRGPRRTDRERAMEELRAEGCSEYVIGKVFGR
jgi:hypothetical protein